MLRRGGLFVSCEWGRHPAMADRSDVSVRAPSAHTFFNAVRETLRDRRGIYTMTPRIPYLLRSSGYFGDVQERSFQVAIGDWPRDPTQRELGLEYREMLKLYAHSMRALLSEGRWADDADRIIQDYIDEIMTVEGMVSTCYTVWARRG